MLKFWSLHPVELSITIVSKRWGVGYFSLCTVYRHPVTSSWLTSLCAGGWGHPVTLSWLASLCVGAQGHPVTLSWLTSSICQGQSRSGHYQVHHQGLVKAYISSISWDGGLLFQTEWQGTAGAVAVGFGVTDCAWGGMCTVGVICSVWGIAAGWGVAGATHGAGCTAFVAGGCVGAAGATFVVMCLSSLMASGWCSCMWSQACQYCPPLMTWTMYNPWSAVQMTVAGSHRCLASLRTDTVCPVNSGAFCWQPWWSWFAAPREACWSRWAWLAVACGSA